MQLHLSIHIKIWDCVGCVLSMLLYGCETCTTYRHHNKSSMRSIFAAYGPSSASLGVTIPNTTLLERTGAPDILSFFRIYRPWWSSHMCRKEDDRLPKDIYGQLWSSHKLCYKDVSKRGLKALNMDTQKWEKLTLERVSWCSLLQDRQAQLHPMFDWLSGALHPSLLWKPMFLSVLLEELLRSLILFTPIIFLRFVKCFRDPMWLNLKIGSLEPAKITKGNIWTDT